MRKKIGLVLGAGGARGFCHVGVIEVLQENNIPIDVVTGCSMGALIGGGFAAGISSKQMREIANRVTTHTVFDVDWRNAMQGGLASGNRAMNIFRKYAGEQTRIEDCKIKFAAIAADMRAHRLHVFNSGLLWQAVRASISIPAVFQPIEHNGMILVDGGVLKRMPISEARDLGADIIIAVDAIGPPSELTSLSTFRVLDAAYQSIDWRSAQHEGRQADILIVPDLRERSSFIFRNNEQAIQIGREAAIKALPSIMRLIASESMLDYG